MPLKLRFFSLRFISFLTLTIISVSGMAQTKIDSLRNSLSTAKTASDKYEAQKQIGRYYYYNGSYDTALVETKKAVKLVPYSNKAEKADAIYRVAKVYHHMEDMTSTIYYYSIAYKMYIQANSEPDVIANVLKDMGRAYYDNSQYDSAMVYYMQSKEIYEKNNIMNHDYGVLFHYIGSVFKRQDNMDKACEYYQMEIDFGKKYNDLDIVAEGFYLQAECVDNDTARLRHELKALRLYEQLENEQGIALMYNNVALGYQEIGMLDSAYYYNMKSLEFRRKDGGKSHLSSALTNIGDLLMDMGRYEEAEKYLIEAEQVALKTDLKRHIRLVEIYEGFYELNYHKGKYKDAADYLLLMYQYEDSATDEAHQDAIHEMELAYQTEKKEAEITMLEIDRNLKEQEKEMAQADAARESANKKIYMFGGLGMLLIALFALFKWRESQKQKRIINEQKHKVELQKEIIEEKNKDIVDSMVYASSIQQAIITSEEYISGMFTDFFVIYKPRDIVSGDFYWAYHADDGKKYIAVGDCTGHGVPGAMMSMLGTAFLNEVVIEGKEQNPEKVLEKMRSQVKKAMSKKGARDGMDMSFCCIDGTKLSFSGANLPVYVLRDKEFIEIKGDKQPVGYQLTDEAPFAVHHVDLNKNDKIYLFSDGYADQFGGPKGKKYKYKTFRDKLAQIAILSFSEQSKIINEEFEMWKGDLEQLDDVCVIGVTI